MSGTGERFITAGYHLPKPLIEVAGKPIIQHVLEMYPNWENILFIVNSDHSHNETLNLEARLLRLAPTAKIHVIDPHKFGPTHAVLQAKDSLINDGPIVINYCDFAGIFDLEAYERKIFDYDSVLLTYTGFHPHMLRSTKFAYLKSIAGEFVDIQEKQSYTESPMEEEASAGAYSFRNKQLLLNSIQTQIDYGFLLKDELYTSLTVKALMQNGGIVKTTLMSKFFQWGTPEDLEDFKMQKDFFIYKFNKTSRNIQVDRIEILAAGSGKRFSDRGYREIKPFLPAGENFLALQAMEALGNPRASRGILLQDSHIIANQDYQILEDHEIQVRKVKGLTKGQAASALIAISSESAGSCIVGTCDSLVFLGSHCKLPSPGKTIGIWVTRPSEFAITHPEQFGWVTLDSNGKIMDSWVKKEPLKESEVFVITGTFYFGNDVEAKELLKSFLEQDITVNNEFYLDSLLEFAVQESWSVFGLIPECFVSLGTPEEYETYRYWESVFSSRPDLLVKDES